MPLEVKMTLPINTATGDRASQVASLFARQKAAVENFNSTMQSIASAYNSYDLPASISEVFPASGAVPAPVEVSIPPREDMLPCYACSETERHKDSCKFANFNEKLMVSKLESDFTKRVCDEIEKECGGITFVLPGGATSSGLADRLIVVKGLMALVEFKGPETPDRENQLLTAKRIVQRVPGVYFKARMGAGAGGQPLYRLSAAWIEAGETVLAWMLLPWDGSGKGLVGAMRAFQEVKPTV